MNTANNLRVVDGPGSKEMSVEDWLAEPTPADRGEIAEESRVVAEAMADLSYDTLMQLMAKRIDQDNAEYNELVDQVESLQATLALAQAEANRANEEVESLKRSAATVISNAEKIQAVAEKERAARKVEQAELRELRKLDPKRLAKVNKEQKAKIAELKESNKKLDAQRKEALRQHKIMLKQKQDAGQYDSWTCPKTGKAIRITHLRVGKDNEYGGVPHTPVLEFYNPESGVTRQGLLNVEGGISWTADECKIPEQEISTIGKETVLAFCSRHNIKIPKEAR